MSLHVTVAVAECRREGGGIITTNFLHDAHSTRVVVRTYGKISNVIALVLKIVRRAQLLNFWCLLSVIVPVQK